MPNRRRRRLSTTMSAVAALAVASPFAIVAFSELATDTADTTGISDAPQHREFVRASSMTDLPGELMNALSQGLSQFGVSMPPVPNGLGGSGPLPMAPGLTSPAMPPGLTSPGLTSPGLTSPLTSPGLTSPGLTSPALPGQAVPGLTTPGLPGQTVPGLTTPGVSPSLTDPLLANPALTNPAAAVPGLTSPTGLDPTGLGGAGEVPIAYDPGLDGTYPILGDPSLGGMPGESGGGGIVSDLMSAANRLGAGQAIDLLKGTVMPSIMQAAQGAAAPAAAAPAAAAPAADAAIGAATAAAGAGA